MAKLWNLWQRTPPSAAAMRGVNDYWREFPSGTAHREAVGGLWDEIGRLQFDFLKSRGLQPHHRLVDVGCGCLRGGVHFVRYLQPGHYFGLDVNESLLKAGETELQKAGLADRQARLLADDGFHVERFEATFDFALAVSLFTHLFANHIVRCLVEVRRALAPGGRFYATYFEAPHARHLEPLTHSPGGFTTRFDADPFHYSREELECLAQPAGFDVEFVGDWGHPRAQRMACFRPR